ncbi:pyridoxal phosphate-dependent aminotransferase [Aeromonas salmonicida]|uniref:pyridoxal phosphate-dependent aminotransferase n=1 Tax=Aeromonas salmonicida TaxID=645 RepID=UPI003D1A8203
MISLNKIIRHGVFHTERKNIRQKLSERENYIRLDLNENVLDLDASLFNEFVSGLTPEMLSAYPDLSKVYTEMATFLSVSEDELILTNGSDLAIKCLYDACIEKGDQIIVHDPYYLMYAFYASFSEAELVPIPVGADWQPDLAAMYASVTEKTKIVVIEAPSGNIGTKPSHQELRQLAAKLEQRNVLLVIDEAYHHVINNESENLDLIREFSNVVIIRTLSKVFGLAGARVGMLIGNEAIVHELYKVRPLYEISSLAAQAAKWRLAHTSLLDAYQQEISAAKVKLIEGLNRLDIPSKTTEGNFIIIYFPDTDGVDLYTLLRSHHVLIGKKYELPALQGWWRITLGNDLHHEKLLSALSTIRQQIRRIN